jgi:hypothetical protein
MATSCSCTSEKCNHANGEPCGQPVEHPQDIQSHDEEGPAGPWGKMGLCEECLKRVTPLWEKITERVLRIWS